MVTKKKNVKLPPRVAMRPDPAQWNDDDALTLVEGAALFWPHGPLTTTSLRTAAKSGQLAFSWVAGKVLTTPAALKAMVRPAVLPAPVAKPIVAPVVAVYDDDDDAPPAPRAKPSRRNIVEAAQADLIADLTARRRPRTPRKPSANPTTK